MFASLQQRFIQLERKLYFSFAARADSKRTHAQNGESQDTPAHLRTGERGEDEAFFYLRERGYTVVARRWRSERLRGDLDLVAWDGDTLVIFEVKTRTARDFAPAESAVDPDKQRMLRRMSAAYIRQFPERHRQRVPVRFDVLSIYLLEAGIEFEHFQNAFPHAASWQ